MHTTAPPHPHPHPPTCRFEGPDCTLDVNECARGGSAACPPGSSCINSEGGFECVAPPAAPRLEAALEAFWHDGGQGCDGGEDVPFPYAALGLGYVEDPTGFYEREAPHVVGGGGHEHSC